MSTNKANVIDTWTHLPSQKPNTWPLENMKADHDHDYFFVNSALSEWKKHI